MSALSCTASGSSYHYLLVCAPAQSFFKALRSVSEAAVLKCQRVHLILDVQAEIDWLVAVAHRSLYIHTNGNNEEFLT